MYQRIEFENKKLKKEFSKIARDIAEIETLEQRWSDSLDFHELSVWTIEQLMYLSYLLGKEDCK
ncbi:MAG: hypothetical protein NC200_07050 [Candidatus Gastranaerophilales bacterium]|nr:hypothetical protein [Candidatus Gastranaerophilales bacterium]